MTKITQSTVSQSNFHLCSLVEFIPLTIIVLICANIITTTVSVTPNIKNSFNQSTLSNEILSNEINLLILPKQSNHTKYSSIYFLKLVPIAKNQIQLDNLIKNSTRVYNNKPLKMTYGEKNSLFNMTNQKVRSYTESNHTPNYIYLNTIEILPDLIMNNTITNQNLLFPRDKRNKLLQKPENSSMRRRPNDMVTSTTVKPITINFLQELNQYDVREYFKSFSNSRQEQVTSVPKIKSKKVPKSTTENNIITTIKTLDTDKPNNVTTTTQKPVEFHGPRTFILSKPHINGSVSETTQKHNEFQGPKTFILSQPHKNGSVVQFPEISQTSTTPTVSTTTIQKLTEFHGPKTFILSQPNKNGSTEQTSQPVSESTTASVISKLQKFAQNAPKKEITTTTEAVPIVTTTDSSDFDGAKLFLNKKMENILETSTKFLAVATVKPVQGNFEMESSKKFLSKFIRKNDIDEEDETSTLNLDYISDESSTADDNQLFEVSTSDINSTIVDYEIEILTTSLNLSIENTQTDKARVGFEGAQKYLLNKDNTAYQKSISNSNINSSVSSRIGLDGVQKLLISQQTGDAQNAQIDKKDFPSTSGQKITHRIPLNRLETEINFDVNFNESLKEMFENETLEYHVDFDRNSYSSFYYTPRSISGKYLTSGISSSSSSDNDDNILDEEAIEGASESYIDTAVDRVVSSSSMVTSVRRRPYQMMRHRSLNAIIRNGFEPIQRRDRSTVSLLGLFELSTRHGERPEGRSELAAAKLAVKHINELNLLPGYTLELLTNDTQCDPGVGVDRFFHALYTQRDTRMVMLLGSACSEVTESLAKVVPYWNIVQVSFGSTSPALSDRSEFPLFYRTVAPDSSHNPARIAFVRKFGWDTVTALSQNEDIYSLAINDLVTELERSNITCTATITFAVTDFKDQMKMLRDLDTRIIIGSFSYKIAPQIFCEAYQLGMYGADYAWILQGGPGDAWWTNTSALNDLTDCTPQQLAEATEGLILVSSHNCIVGTDPSLSGLTNEMFESELEKLDVPMSRYAPQTYDAVWAMALALRGAEERWRSAGTTVAHFDYTRKDMADEFLQQLAALNFSGISGPVSFSGSDRVGTSAFHQVQGGEINTVALFYPSTRELDFECARCVALQWTGGQVPIAKRVFKLRVVTIAPAAFLAISSLAVIGITIAIAFLAFNLHFRRLKSIKLSSPRLNNMAAVGCILVYAAVILLGLDHATLQNNDHFSTVCTARVYLLSAGFSLAFGSMFTKTYRVHHIFTRSRSGVVKNKLLQDTQLILMICVLLLMDGLIVTLWVIIDPMQRHLRNLTIEISSVDRGVVYQPQVEVCISQNTNGWLGALYVYKGLLLIVGVYMAWETRHVKIPALNDSEYIGMSVYSVVITSGIVVVLANLMSEQATLAFVTITMLILISTTSTLCLLFLPKLHAILGEEDNTDPVVESMGLKIEYNTRRFVTDDRRELQYRVEVQNRVYRREVAALDLEIGRLEKLLLETTSSSSDSSSTSSLNNAQRANKNLPEVSIIDETNSNTGGEHHQQHPRTTSIGGGLPLLLLSVLPPVIPRASWPSADHCTNPMRRSVTFSSEPKLDESKTCISHQPIIDLLNLRLRHDPSMLGVSEKPSMLERIKNFFGSKPSVRKTSTASYGGNSSVGIAAALKSHMGYIAGLVPGTNRSQMASSCNTSTMMIDQLSSKELLKRHSTAQCSSGPTINITSDEENAKRKFSLALSTVNKIQSSEPHVNFEVPTHRKMSIVHQQSQPVLSFRERAKGSPRFPHKIVPTCSLTALEDRRKSSVGSGGASRRSSHQPPQKLIKTDSTTGSTGSNNLAGKWHSMEDAAFSMPAGMRRGSGALATSCLPLNMDFQPRASSYSPNSDVWATAEFGIPLSEFNNNNNSKRAENNDTTAGDTGQTKQTPSNENNSSGPA